MKQTQHTFYHNNKATAFFPEYKATAFSLTPHFDEFSSFVSLSILLHLCVSFHPMVQQTKGHIL